MSFEMTLEKWILVIAAVLALGTGMFVYQYEEQDPAIVNEYQEEITDDVEIKDIIVDVSPGATEKEVRSWIKENYPDYEIIEIAYYEEQNRYLVRIKEVSK
ncbi:hypothetical protein [Geotoga petraea]|jgi:hypothetical protein|uniref:Uncharacterized protein n=1 Tax=Geotoga petraea TaxID=28234 RepID=A0A1G6LW64_9BACT|nr:hypothetical protein [Geotoga petraea]SDC46946.1 hypothetical protein SAMN04488588_1151 [Geotoga petraea]